MLLLKTKEELFDTKEIPARKCTNMAHDKTLFFSCSSASWWSTKMARVPSAKPNRAGRVVVLA